MSIRKWLGLGTAVAGLLLTGPAGRGIVPRPALAAQTWEVKAGIDIASESLAGNAFFPAALTINAGDTVTFTIGGFHTVTFNAGNPPLGVFLPGPGEGELQFGPALFPFPPGPSAPSGPYAGSQQISSGVPLEPDTPPFQLTFTQTGIFPYLCMVHPGMAGQIEVLPAGAPLTETPEQAAARGQAEFAGARAELEGVILAGYHPSRAASPGGSTIHMLNVGLGLGNRMSALRFTPAEYTVRRGDTIVWTNADPSEVHTVTFLSGAPAPPEVDIRPQPGGPPLLVIPAPIAGPAGGDTYRGTGTVNSGILTPGVSVAFTIDAAPGTYEYICLIHSGAVAESLGAPPMKGRITVVP